MSADKQIQFVLTQKQGVGSWWVESPQIPGLLAVDGTIPDALENAARSIRNLALAFAHEAAEGRQPKPIFSESASAEE